MIKSMWADNPDIKIYSTLQKDLEADIVIIGGSLVSIVCAYRLLKEGYTVAILESDHIYKEENMDTYGNVTSQHGLFYHGLIQKIGIKQAQLVIKSQNEAFESLFNNIKDIEIECQYDTIIDYIYTDQNDLHQLYEEYEAAKKLGVDVFKTELSYSISQKSHSIGYKNQGQFNISKYIVKLLWYFEKKDIYLIEQSKVVNVIEEHEYCITQVENGYQVKSKYVICTEQFSNFDFLIPYTQQLKAIRKHIIAMDIQKTLDRGIYTNINTKITFRSHKYNKKTLILIAKNDASEEVSNEEIHYSQLREIGEKYFGLNQQIYKWTSKQYHTNDKLPLIGKVQNKNKILIACGFNGCDVIDSHVSANVIKDLIKYGKSDYEMIYNPNRFYQ